MTAAPIRFAQLLSSITTSLIDVLLLPRSCGALPAVIRPLSGDGRTFSCISPVRVPLQPIGEGGVGRNEAGGRSVGHDRENPQFNAGTLNPSVAAVIRQVPAVFPHGGARC